MPNADTLELHRSLRAWADGYSPDAAAVDLLIAHGTWLHRNDFRHHLVPGHTGDGQEITAIDWEGLLEVRTQGLPASSSEVAVLDIALSLAANKPVPLGEVLGLDATNTAAVATALVRAAQHSARVTVTLADPNQPPNPALPV
ncbi:hypothetical protein IDM40_08345 [Nocardiopsis sp. HNM0947]|uniref:Uncharacterized protein n=1 Tax=Nocardiopsis coralli TaxID=2772213 RepID=A0ABR9P4H2_9ACTN|nr:hypothetical protein [Nocardiopsis coralli]MBE2998710.1 hypothetical protein [Nocardiopsis coralli]